MDKKSESVYWEVSEVSNSQPSVSNDCSLKNVMVFGAHQNFCLKAPMAAEHAPFTQRMCLQVQFDGLE